MAAHHIARNPVAVAAGLYAACLGAAWLTEYLHSLPNSGISIWLPSGLVLAAALASRRARWPLWAAAAIAAEMTGNLIWYRHDIGPALLLAGGNAAAALIGATVVRRFITKRQILTTVRNAGIVILVAAILMPLLSATTASIGLGWSYGKPWFDAWLRIFLGDATGSIVAAPAGLLLFGAAAPPVRVRTRLWEAGALFVVFAGVAAISLGNVLPFAFLMIPPLLWAALAFRMPGAIVASVALTLFAAVFTLAGMGPFSTGPGAILYPGEALQLFIAVAGMTGLLIGAIAEENRRGVKRLYAANRTLEHRVAARTASLATSESQARELTNLLSAIGSACPDLIYAKDRNHNIIYANEATLSVMGAASLDALRAAGEREHYGKPDEFDAVQSNDEKVLTTRETLVVEELFTGGDGIRRVYRTTKAPLFDANGDLAGLAGVSVDISDIKRSQERERMLVREVEHRSRNLLTVVQGIVQLTRADSVADFKSMLGKKIRTLARTNSAIAASHWTGADLEEVLTAELEPYRYDEGQNIALAGEPVMLDPAAAQSFALVAHELTTNAAKYGCLSTGGGSLCIRWTVGKAVDGGRLLKIVWAETGGPPVSPPANRGFGTTMIEALGREQPGSHVAFDWAETGLTVNLTIPLAPEGPLPPAVADPREAAAAPA